MDIRVTRKIIAIHWSIKHLSIWIRNQVTRLKITTFEEKCSEFCYIHSYSENEIYFFYCDTVQMKFCKELGITGWLFVGSSARKNCKCPSDESMKCECSDDTEYFQFAVT